MMLPGMRQVQQLLLVRAPGARGEGVQHRLPDVGRAAIDQDNACLAATTQRVPKTGCQDQSGNPPPAISTVRPVCITLLELSLEENGQSAEPDRKSDG